MSLQSYVQSFSVQAPSGRLVAGTPITLRAVAGEILDVPTTEVITGPVSLSAVLKHIQLPPEAGVTPWPPPAPATIVSSVSSGPSTAPAPGAIEAWAATITGTVPVGFRDISGQIRVDLRWRFTDDRGNALGDVAIVGGSLSAESVTIALPPAFTELTGADFGAALAATPVTRRIGVQLSVRGRIGTSQDTGEVLVPPAPLPLEFVAIPLPSVAALFRDEQLKGDALLLMTPKGSPFESAAPLLGVLDPLRNLLGTVKTAAALTTWAAGAGGVHDAVSDLQGRIPLTTHVGFKAADSFKDLGKYNFISRRHWDTDIEDRGSSALLISPSRAISFFQHDDFKGHELTLDAVPSGLTRLGGATVARLHVNVPESAPPGCVSISGSPGGGWGDKISSYRWGPISGG